MNKCLFKLTYILNLMGFHAIINTQTCLSVEMAIAVMQRKHKVKPWRDGGSEEGRQKGGGFRGGAKCDLE